MVHGGGNVATMTRIGQSRTPSDSELLTAAISEELRDFYVALPGKIETYDPLTQTATVKPLLKRAYVDEDGEEDLDEIQPLTQVPIVFPRGGGMFITFPMQKGDNVLLVFNDRSIDSYMTSTGGVDLDPVDLREHDPSDAVAFPGFFPLPKSIKDLVAKDLVIGAENKGMQMRITKAGTVEFHLGGVSPMHVAIVEKLQALWTTMKTTLDTWGGAAGHTHATGVGPSGPPTPPLNTNAWDPAINSTKMSIPDG